MGLIYCRECGKKVSDSSDVCIKCGAPLNKAPKEQNNSGEIKEVSWSTTLIVSILVGYLGIDRFIMGHVGLGLLKLFTVGGCGIWWLIDVILIATKHKFTDIKWI